MPHLFVVERLLDALELKDVLVMTIAEVALLGGLLGGVLHVVLPLLVAVTGPLLAVLDPALLLLRLLRIHVMVGRLRKELRELLEQVLLVPEELGHLET